MSEKTIVTVSFCGKTAAVGFHCNNVIGFQLKPLPYGTIEKYCWTTVQTVTVGYRCREAMAAMQRSWSKVAMPRHTTTLRGEGILCFPDLPRLNQPSLRATLVFSFYRVRTDGYCTRVSQFINKRVRNLEICTRFKYLILCIGRDILAGDLRIPNREIAT